MSLGPLQSLFLSATALGALVSVASFDVLAVDPPKAPAAAASGGTKPAMNGDVPEGFSSFQATVATRLSAGQYSYLELRASDGRRVWLATMGVGAQRGERVAVRAYSAAQNFESRRLGRRFDALLFGQVSPAETR